MKRSISIKIYSILFFLSSTMKAFADFTNPEEPPEDVPLTPIEDHLWILMIIGLVFMFWKLKSGPKKLLYVKNSFKNANPK